MVAIRRSLLRKSLHCGRAPPPAAEKHAPQEPVKGDRVFLKIDGRHTEAQDWQTGYLSTSMLPRKRRQSCPGQAMRFRFINRQTTADSQRRISSIHDPKLLTTMSLLSLFHGRPLHLTSLLSRQQVIPESRDASR